MSRVDLNDLNSQYVDVFKELGNIGAGNASTALAHMLNMKVDMSVPEVSLLEFKDAGSILGGEETIVCGVYLSVQGDITGSIMFLLDVSSAKKLTNKLMGIESTTEGLDEMEGSALKEIGNIITSAYLNSLATSPLRQTFLSAITGKGGVPVPFQRGMIGLPSNWLEPLTSFAVITLTTPGIVSASVVSILIIFACSASDKTTAR